jgi:hypothetical protein
MKKPSNGRHIDDPVLVSLRISQEARSTSVDARARRCRNQGEHSKAGPRSPDWPSRTVQALFAS